MPTMPETSFVAIAPAAADKTRPGGLKMAAALTRRGLLLLILGVAILAAVGYALQPVVLGPLAPAYRTARQDLAATVVASGRVLTPFRAEIGSPFTGMVASVPVAEGQAVKKGQPLIILESSDLQAAVRQATANVAQAQAKLVQMERVALPAARMNRLQTQAALANARLTYDRMERLLAQDSIARAQFDSARSALDTAEAQDQAAALQVATNGAGGADRVLAETQLASAQANQASAQARLAYSVIRAPTDGVLIARDVEEGDVVAPGKALMVLSPSAETQLVINVDEKNLGRLAVGQKAMASADAFPDRRFDAEVVYINPGVDAQTAAVEVKLRVPAPPTYLRQDMTVSVDILSAFHPHALVIPADALRRTPAGRPYVLVADKGRAVQREVAVGERSGGQVQVLSGLEAGEWVFSGSAKVQPGQRARPAPHA
jgi:HlyD family secretion protein